MGVIQLMFFIFFILVYFGITGMIVARLFGRGPDALVK
jgi:hypothetical protein